VTEPRDDPLAHLLPGLVLRPSEAGPLGDGLEVDDERSGAIRVGRRGRTRGLLAEYHLRAELDPRVQRTLDRRSPHRLSLLQGLFLFDGAATAAAMLEDEGDLDRLSGVGDQAVYAVTPAHRKRPFFMTSLLVRRGRLCGYVGVMSWLELDVHDELVALAQRLITRMDSAIAAAVQRTED